MTTPRDLFVVTLDVASSHPAPGDLSLALAGAELIDLLRLEAAVLDGERIVPATPRDVPDPMLAQAAASLRPQVPHETVEDWLWRRGRGLSVAYRDAFEAEGLLTLRRRRWLPAWIGQTALVDSPTRTRAGHRWAAEDPVLAALATAAGVSDRPAADLRDVTDESVVTILAAVDDAVTELVGVRHRKSIEDAAFSNVWRGA
ncbi:GPP34 family phosphoprotein [Streptomyces sp. NPDC047000]|uniref:GPP34 family phosphoprotein n=1 Tax=Streptomyces sp. NPDC047000 TaxID=3155474 RepID=UPI0033EDC0AD